MENMELRLINIAQKIADKYKEKIENDNYKQLINAINVCREYCVQDGDDWTVMYDVVLGEDGIWEQAELYDSEKEIGDVWAIETCILMCNCYIGCCIKSKEPEPEDMELREENIPKFIDFMEKELNEKLEFDKIFTFWDEEMCY